MLARFRSGQISALIGTNVAARGLDIPEVDLVVHFRLPNEAEAYQHRSGRTGRAGRTGTVIVLYGPRERRDLANIEHSVSRSFTKSTPPTPETIQAAKLNSLMINARAQSEKDKAQWLGEARDLMASGDAEVLAGLLAVVLGGAPNPRSLLTGEEGWITLELSGDIRNVGQVVRLLKTAGANDIGRIQLGRNTGYADVKADEASFLIAENSNIRRAENVPIARAPKGNSSRKPKKNRSRRRNEARR